MKLKPMSYQPNEDYLQSIREEFDESVVQSDWDECRSILANLESMGVDTFILRRDMNIAMAEQAELDGSDEPEDYSNSTIENYGL